MLSRRYKYLQLWLVIIGIAYRDTLFMLAVVENLDLLLEIDDICHIFPCISTSGFGGHVAILRCLSMSRLFVDSFFELLVGENFAFTTRNTVILTLEVFGRMSQHELEISPVSK